MELRVLRYFLAVARSESISGAAEVLHVTQPTLSRQLMDLEKEVGKTLFLRGKRRITLTEEGVLLRKRAAEILDLVDKTAGELAFADETIAGDVYIGARRNSRRPLPHTGSQTSPNAVSGHPLPHLQRRPRGCDRTAGPGPH